MARLDYSWKIDLGLWGGFVGFIIFMIFKKEKERRNKRELSKLKIPNHSSKISSLCLTKLSSQRIRKPK